MASFCHSNRTKKEKEEKMAKKIEVGEWNLVPSEIQIGTRCRIGTSLRESRNAWLTRIVKTFNSIQFFGKLSEVKPEEILAKINTQKSTGHIHTTPVDGIVLRWVETNGDAGTLTTFPGERQYSP